MPELRAPRIYGWGSLELGVAQAGSFRCIGKVQVVPSQRRPITSYGSQLSPSLAPNDTKVPWRPKSTPRLLLHNFLPFAFSHRIHLLPTHLFRETEAFKTIFYRIVNSQAILHLELLVSTGLETLARQVARFALRSWLVYLSLLSLSPPLITSFLSYLLGHSPRTEPACFNRSLSKASNLVQPATTASKRLLFRPDLPPAHT